MLLFAFVLSSKIAADPPPNPLSDPTLLSLQRPNESQWSLDQGSEMQIIELVHQLIKRNGELEERYRDDPESLAKILAKKNVRVQNAFGSATRIQLSTPEGPKELVRVTLKESHGEEVDIILVDFTKFSSDSPDFHVFLAQTLKYAPVEVERDTFGKSVLVVNTPLGDELKIASALKAGDQKTFFPRGKNLRAFVKATFFAPKFDNVVMNLPSSIFQVGTATAIGLASNHWGISDTPYYIPAVLSAIYSTFIGWNGDTYSVLVKMGSERKKFLFNFLGTSLSYSIILNLWDIGTKFFTSAARLTFTVINGLAGNVVKGALYRFSNIREQTGLVEGEYRLKLPSVGIEFSSAKALVQREFLYSGIANPMRLLDLTANATTNGHGAANTEAKIAVKAFYLAFASIAHWCIVRYTELIAARARQDPDFAKKVDIKAITDTAAKLRRGVEEAKYRILHFPRRVWDSIAGRSLEPFNHKKVDAIFLKWSAHKAAYLYRLEHSQEILEPEISYYRNLVANDMVQLGLEAAAVHDFEAPVASEGELKSFVYEDGAGLRTILQSQLEKASSRLPDELVERYRQYAVFLESCIESARELFASDSKRDDVSKRQLLGLLFQLVADFSSDARSFGAEHFEQDLAERFGVYAGKAVEHFTSRLVLWRYLYNGSIPAETRSEFLEQLRNRQTSKFSLWALESKARVGGFRPPVPLDDDHHHHILQGYRSAFSRELSEIFSLAREFNRRIEFKLARFPDSQALSESDLGHFSEELLAFHALRDYQRNFENRWADLLQNRFTRVTPKSFWSYSQERHAKKSRLTDDANNGGGAKGGRGGTWSCLAGLREAFGPLGYIER